jgi:hypothetical protein
MQRARFVQTLGLLLMLGLAGFGSGCGMGSSAPMSEEASEKYRESKKKGHGQLKADIKKIEAESDKKDALGRRGGHRGRGGQ